MLRKMMMAGALALLACSALAGCVSADGAVRDATESERFASICRNEPGVHATFTIIAAATDLKASVVNAEASAHAVVSSVCANPPANVGEALAAAADAYAQVLALGRTAALKESG